MLETGLHEEQIAGSESVLLPGRAKSDVTVEDVNRDGAGGVVCGDLTAGPHHHQRYAKGPFLEEGAGVAAVTVQTRGVVDVPAFRGEIETQDIAGQGTIDGRHQPSEVTLPHPPLLRTNV